MNKYKNRKKILSTKSFVFNFTIVSANLIQIGSLVTEIQNYGKDVRLILYNINLLQKLWPISKTALQQNSFIFDFMFE